MMNNNCIIAEDFKLPSEAKIYDEQFDPNIRLRSMTVREEMKRLSTSVYPHKVLCEIIDACLLTKLPMSVYDLHVGDYEYLLHKLRVVTYGPDYKMIVGCPHCNSTHDQVVNLDELQNKPLDLEGYASTIKFILPNCKKEIQLRMQTPRLLDSVEYKINEFKKKNTNIDIDMAPIITLQNMIELVDGKKLSYAELENFVNNLSARDYNYINLKISNANAYVGINSRLNINCKRCGGEINTFFRFGSEFFRPTTDQ